MLNLQSAADRLSDHIVRCGISQRTLSQELDCCQSQLNKWLKGREPIPTYAINNLGAALGLTGEEVECIIDTRECHSQIQDLFRYLDRIPADDFPVSTNLIGDAIVRSIQGAVPENSYWNEGEQLKDLRKGIAAACMMIRWLRNFFSCEKDIISPDNIHLHLQFPQNILIGSVIGLPQTFTQSSGALFASDEILEFMRRQALSKPSAKPLTDLCRQHALHILARYGHRKDQDLVQDCIAARHVETENDLGALRMGLYGLAAANRSKDTVERFLFEMKRNRHFSEQTIRFDSVHYGDTHFRNAQRRRAWTYEQSSLMLVRHLIGRANVDVEGIAYAKLTAMLRTSPSREWLETPLRIGLRKLLQTLAATDRPEPYQAELLSVALPALTNADGWDGGGWGEARGDGRALANGPIHRTLVEA